jgi:hypothetical protein
VAPAESGLGAVLIDIFGWLAALGLAGGGIALIVIGRNRQKAAPPDGITWLPAVATVLSSGVETEAEAATAEGAEPVTWYAPAVRYEYQVGGETYIGSRIGKDDAWLSARGEAEEIAARYQPPAGIEISYDADNPEHCVIERERAEPNMLVPAGAVALIVSAALALSLIF